MCRRWIRNWTASVTGSVSDRISGTVMFHQNLAKSWNTGQCHSVLLRLPLDAGAGETGEVQQPPAVLAGRPRTSPVGAQQAPVPPDLGGHAMLDPRGHCHSHHEERQPGVCFSPCCGWEPGQHWEAQCYPQVTNYSNYLLTPLLFHSFLSAGCLSFFWLTLCWVFC